MHRLIGLIMALLALTSSAAATELSQPLSARNFYPPMMRFFDPTPDSALRSYKQSLSFELNQHYSSVNMFDFYPNPQLLVDMELYVIDPVVRYAVGSRSEFSLRMPLLRPHGGAFDGIIQSVHRVFSMPNGGRELRPSNSYAYAFDNGQGVSWQGRSRWELGNMELSGRYQMMTRESWGLAALSAVKFPTASKSRGWGSGASDLAAGAVLSWQQDGWFTHLEGWYVHPFASDEPGIRYGSYLRGSVTGGYQFESISLIVQAQGGESPYKDTNYAALDHPPFLITFGMRGQTDAGIGWSITVIENISQKTTQDLSLSFGLDWSL